MEVGEMIKGRALNHKWGHGQRHKTDLRQAHRHTTYTGMRCPESG